MNVPAVGEIFAGKYAILAVVGRGGMGVVLAARHIELDERVAIKLILSDDGPKVADFVARFVREAKLASKIKNEHVVRVLDVARLETGEPYIVMELLEGQDLSELLAQRGPLPLELAALYLLQACEAIAEAHSLGIVHRDLKPANLFLTTRRDGQPCVKVLDFGISKLVGEGGQAMTKTNALMGSPYYMSPDQLVQSRDVDARSDVWTLGVILFELLTQRYPFDAEDAPQLIAHILHSAPPSLSVVRPDLPLEIAQLIEATLVKDRTQRIQNVAEFSRRLAPFAPEGGRYSLQVILGTLSRQSGSQPAGIVSSSPAAWGAASASAQGPVSAISSGSATAPGATMTLQSTKKSGRATLLVAVLGTLAVSGIAAALFLRSHGAAAPAPSAAVAAAPLTVASSAAPSANGEPAPTVAVSSAAPPAVSVAPVVSAAPASSAVAADLHATPAIKPSPRPTSVVPARPSRPATHATPDPFGGVR